MAEAAQRAEEEAQQAEEKARKEKELLLELSNKRVIHVDYKATIKRLEEAPGTKFTDPGPLCMRACCSPCARVRPRCACASMRVRGSTPARAVLGPSLAQTACPTAAGQRLDAQSGLPEPMLD